MLKPDPHSDEQQPEEDVVMQGSPSFEELMMLVFSGPMCLECLDEAESEEGGIEEESETETGGDRTETGGEAQPR